MCWEVDSCGSFCGCDSVCCCVGDNGMVDEECFDTMKENVNSTDLYCLVTKKIYFVLLRKLQRIFWILFLLFLIIK